MSEYWPDGEVAVYTHAYATCEIGECDGQIVYRWLHRESPTEVEFRLYEFGVSDGDLITIIGAHRDDRYGAWEFRTPSRNPGIGDVAKRTNEILDTFLGHHIDRGHGYKELTVLGQIEFCQGRYE